MNIDFENGDVSVVIENRNNCCFAYYYYRGEILGDVWLFNIGPTPVANPWESGLEPPYQNAEKYCYPHSIVTPVLDSNFRVMFNPENDKAGIYFRDKLVGIVGPNLRPGKSAFAKEDSPVACKMTSPVPLPT